MKRISSRLLALAGLVIAVVVLVLAVVNGPALSGSVTSGSVPSSSGTTTAPSPAPSAPLGSALESSAPAPANTSGLAAVNASQLPQEARQTLALIAKGGPYPYERDGVNFGNFEGLLPKKSGGYYKEYTVKTPGESDRGARRIIAGKDGAKYYTPDHYESFKFIVEGK
ncbi:ribonuclease domain-containing protein [Arthrobacter sp. CJ23]|uniref:ribonuclease domain-containing protein n=1 Tax=Arthrobacter sp. CJ23 TaxID=2972479 RepID=UPI00215D59FD|nr:ribonuclease domain-containing protein [Arthrobacter sp. CJ23]UVJ40340.1 ribonuclease [Arthrobacter sp. CJ23]